MLSVLEMRRRTSQFVLIACVFALVAYLVLMINGLGTGLNDLAGSAVLNLDADRIAFTSDAGLSVIRSEMGTETVDRVASLPNVTASAPLAYVAASYAQADGAADSVTLLGYDPGTIAEPAILDGRPLSPTDQFGVLADSSFLEDSGYAVGDVFPVRLRLETVPVTIIGEIDQGAFFFLPTIYLLRSTLLDVKYGGLPAGERPAASIVLVQGDDLAGGGDGYELVDKRTAFNNIEGVAGQSSTIASLLGFGYLIGAMVIGVFFYVLTLQKEAQFAMLKAVGATGGFIGRYLLTQVALVALAGIAVATVLAVLTELMLDGQSASVPISLSTGAMIATAVLLLVSAIAGAFFSMRRALRVDPLIALGQQQ